MCRDLDDYDSSELKAELQRRGDRWPDEWLAVDTLEAAGCPPELLAPIREWTDQPVIDEAKLAEFLDRLTPELSKKS